MLPPAAQLGVADQDAAERGVLDDDHQLADHRRQHRGDRLRQQDDRHQLALLSPIACAASVCPRGTARMPARTTSASTEPL